MAMRPFTINAVLFDFDGTLTQKGTLDFKEIKRVLGCPLERPALEFIEQIQDQQTQGRAWEVLEAFETEGARNSVPNKGAENIMTFLRSVGLKVGIITRNSLRSVLQALENFPRLKPQDFDVIISRDTAVKPKPDPEGIFYGALELDVPAEQILVVGDYIFDVDAGNRAGAVTVLLTNGGSPPEGCPPADFSIGALGELEGVVRLGLPLIGGKFPQDLLQQYLENFVFDDPSVIINPGIGEDTTAVDVSNEQVMVLKSDPITFVTDAIGNYLVAVNANDIATSGALPRWLLATILFPAGVTPSTGLAVMEGIQSACEELNITLCGGHTEVTDAVTRVVVSGMMGGTVDRSKLLDKRAIQAGEDLLFTKAVAVEGTSIIAREFGDRLYAMGMTTEEIEKSKTYLSQISIIPEAQIASGYEGVSAMHDVTEGGLATALEEVSIAANHSIEVAMERIPILPETARIAKLLDIDPMGLIGSGSLLICCDPKTTPQLADHLEAAGIPVARIGRIASPGQGVSAVDQGRPTPWPRFEVDELTRLF